MNVFEIFPIASFLVLILLISGRVMFLKRTGVKVSSGSSKRNKSRLFLYILFLPILFLWLFELEKPAFHISFSIFPELITIPLIDFLFMKITGAIIVTVSLFMMLLTLIHFRSSLRFGMAENNLGELITTGIFSITRNPFFVSLDLYFLGIALFLPSLFFICFSVLAILSIHFFILKEEKFMLEMYGDEYEKYAKRARRYF